MIKIKERERIHNTFINIIFGFGAQICILLFSLVNRAIFVRCFSPDYLGINGLYGNILSLLSLTEFGISNVMIYSLYKPVADKNEDRIKALLNFYKKLYLKIAGVVFLIGLCLIPFLRFIVKSDLSFNNLILYYVIYLLNSVASYIGVYKSALLNAEQKAYIVKLITTIVLMFQNLLQITILIIFKNYIAYLVTMVCCTYVTNITLNLFTDKRFPYLKGGVQKKINELPNIFENMKGAFGYQIGTTIIRSTDNILISAIFGTAIIGLCSNYYMIISNLTNYLNIISSALLGSLGNLNATVDDVHSYKVFNVLMLVFHWLAAACALSLWFIFDDWIVWWVGKTYLLDDFTLAMIVLDFYVNTMLYPTWLYRETSGLFKQMKYIMLIAAAINIFFSIVLGMTIGLAGIFMATVICRILTYIWYEPKILYKNRFHTSVWTYWRMRVGYFLATAVSYGICFVVFKDLGHSLVFMVIKGAICFLVSSVCFMIPKCKSVELQYLSGIIYRKLKFRKS